jgi:hypothetical protein
MLDRIRGAFNAWLILSPSSDDQSIWKHPAFRPVAAATGIFVWAQRFSGMPVILKWALWAACLVWLVCEIAYRLPRRTQVVLSIISLIVFVCIFLVTAKQQWRVERAAMLSGILTAPKPHRRYPKAMLYLGGVPFWWAGPPATPILEPLYDSNLTLESTEEGLKFSTIIRDRLGHIVVAVDKNKWSVSPEKSVCWDKNYTTNSLEVEDGRGHVVLQLIIFQDHIALQGEWRDDIGHGLRITRSSDSSHPGALFDPLLPGNETPQRTVQPMFKYPSSEHWGEMVNSSSSK